MVTDGAPGEQCEWLALANLVTQARKAHGLCDDLRYAAVHEGMNVVLDGMSTHKETTCTL